MRTANVFSSDAATERQPRGQILLDVGSYQAGRIPLSEECGVLEEERESSVMLPAVASSKPHAR